MNKHLTAPMLDENALDALRRKLGIHTTAPKSAMDAMQRMHAAATKVMCEFEDFHDGFPAVDDLAGDDGYYTPCGSHAVWRIFGTAYNGEIMQECSYVVCDEHKPLYTQPEYGWVPGDAVML